jgi:hypothetical protein
MAATYHKAHEQVFDGNGDPIVGAKLESYEAGTSTPLSTFSDSDLSTANANPASGATTGNQVTDGNGRLGAIYLKAELYKFVLKDASGVEIWTHDYYDPTGSLSTGLSFSTVAALLAVAKDSLVNGQSYFVNEANKEGRFQWDSTATNTVNSGTIFQSDEGGTGRFFRRDYDMPRLDWFPVTAAGIEAAAAVSNTVYVAGALDFTGEAIDMGDIADCTFIGPGSITGVYRKNVIPLSAPAVGEPAADLCDYHLKQFNTAKAPIVCLVGDSISTFSANTQSRSGMLSEAIRSEVYRQAGGRSVTFYNRSIGGQSWANLDGVATTKPAWYTPTGNDWLTFPQALSPDLVIISLGMNGSSSIDINDIDSVITKIKAWSKVPDIVLATNLTPSMNPVQSPGNETQADQDSRDQAAGLVRSYARYYGYGLLDFGRQHLRVRDGFDPDRTQAMIDPGSNVTLSSDVATGDRTVLHMRAEVTFNAAELVQDDVSSFIDIRIGAGSSDILRIFNTGGNYRFRMFAGTLGGANKTVYTLDSSEAVPGSGTDTWYIEAHGNTVTVHDQDTDFGQYTEPVFSSAALRKGGFFTPEVTFAGASSGTGSGLSSVRFIYGLTALNRPAALNSVLWGDGSSGTDDIGGSSWNHPGSKMGEFVYDPVLRANRFFYRDPNERLDLGVPISTSSITTGGEGTQGGNPSESFAIYLQMPDSSASSIKWRAPRDFDAEGVRIYYIAESSGAGAGVTLNLDAYGMSGTAAAPSETDLFIGTASFDDDAGSDGELQYLELSFNAVTSHLFRQGDEFIMARHGAGGSDTYAALKVVGVQLY